MHSRIQTFLCWTVLLVGLVAATQNSQRSSTGGFHFKDEDSAIEGSGYNGEVNHDLESSGSGFGPSDDEDDIEKPIDRTNVDLTHQGIGGKQPEPDIDKDLTETKVVSETTEDTSVQVVGMNPKLEDRPTSFFAQPGILAAVVGGAVVGLLCAILVVMFIVYRMRKKDEGSYALGEPKHSPNSNSYSGGTNKEFFA